jgi:hypothetical protein
MKVNSTNKNNMNEEREYTTREQAFARIASNRKTVNTTGAEN